MKSNKLLAGALSAAMVLGSVTLPVFADGTKWADSADTNWYTGTESVYTLGTAEELAGLAALVKQGNTFAKTTIKLGGDIDLESKEWSPIGVSGKSFQGTFDGDGSTISNLSITGSGSDVGLFGFTTNGEIKNFTLENASVSGYLDVGAVAGTPYTSKYTDITVKGLVKIDGFAYVGGAFGKNGYADLTNVDVIGNSGSYVKADSRDYRTYIGGLIGFMGEGNQTIADCDVAIDVIGSTCDVGGITGILHYGNKMVNCTYRGNLELTNATDPDVSGEIGGLAGTYLTSPNHVTSITGSSATVSSAKVSDGTTTKDVKDEITSIGTVYSEEHKTNGECTVSAKVNGKQETITNNVAKIGDVKYFSLKDAMQAACNMNVEDVDGIPTQTAPVTIDLVSDIENQQGFYVRGGEKMTTYGSHYVHNIDITINGNGHKIDTGVSGCENPDVKGSPKIGMASMNGKFTVKNIVAPNDLVFDLSKTYDDVLSECSQRESGQADGLTVENCTFYGSNIAYCGSVNNVTYKNNKFLLTENQNNGADSYPLWYKFNNAIKNFTFEGNTVKSERALNLARFAENSEIVVNNNNFTVANSENPAKSAAIMLAENHTETSPYTGNLTFNGNTVDANSAVLVYAPSEYNTNFNLTAKSNILTNGAKLVGYNEWSGSYNDTAAKEAAEALVKKVEKNANGGEAVADTVALKFVPTADERVYDIVLSGDGKNINRLNAAEFKFNLSNTAMTYEIKAADKLTTLQPDADKYVFYFDGKDAVNNADSGTDITIGTVAFDGFGTFTFGATEGKATATTTEDNLVTEFVTTAETGKGALKIADNANKINAEIKVPKQKLAINVLMNHPVTANAADYQNMTVAISGGDLAGKVLTYKLGDVDADIDETTKTVEQVNGSYKIETELTQNRLYTVTVSGAGYRTARYTVTMTEDKTMNVWNNVMSNEIVVVDDTKATKNFLAGDIIRDGIINIYDLSAVVAYFGTDKLVADHPSYAKYDLNRDGVIDMIDISIVLASWGE